MSNLDTLPPIAVACAITAVAMYPVDVARALKMASATGPQKYTMTEFVKTHGIKGALSQGVAPEVARATWMRVLKFFFFPITHEYMWGKPTSKGTPIEKGLAGAVAVIPEVATITTLELAKIGLQLDKEKKYNNSATNLVRDVFRRGGFTACMCGWQGVQARQALWTGTYFATLDSFKKVAKVPFGNDIKSNSPEASAVNFLAGFGAGIAGAVANTPFDVVRTNIQKEGLSGTSKDSPARLAWSFGKMGQVAKEIVKSKGTGALYSGFTMKALHMGGSGAFIAMLIPQCAKMFGVDKPIM